MAPTTFPKFTLLPYELRCKIWTYALVPQHIAIDYYSYIHVLGPRPTPAILHVNYESRAFARRSYILMPVPRNIRPFMTYTEPGVDVGFIYFNPSLDTFGIKAAWFAYYFKAGHVDEWFEMVKRRPGFRVLMTGAGKQLREEVERWKAAAKGNEKTKVKIGLTMIECMEVVD